MVGVAAHLGWGVLRSCGAVSAVCSSLEVKGKLHQVFCLCGWGGSAGNNVVKLLVGQSGGCSPEPLGRVLCI